MDGVRIEVKAESALNTLSEASQRLSQPLEMWQAIGRAMVDSTRRRFNAGAGPGGVRWKPSIRVMRDGGKTLIGVDGESRAEMGILGGLMGSITYEADADGVRWGSNAIHARIHQMGGVIKPKRAPALAFRIGDRTIFADSVTIPARPYLGLDDGDFATIEDIVLDKLDQAFGGAADGGR